MGVNKMISYIAMFFCGFGVAFCFMMILWVFVYFDDERNLEDYFDDDQLSLWDDDERR